jgi:hypothetical protein
MARKEVEVDIYQDEQISMFVIAFKDYFEKILLPFLTSIQIYKHSEKSIKNMI